MELKKIKKTSKILELEVIGENETILNPIVEVLLEDENVDFASCMSKHPESEKRTLLLRLKKGKKAKPEKVLEKAVKQLEDEVKNFSKNFKTKTKKKSKK